MGYPPPLAFGFGAPALLGWLAVAAAPILIHLWMRQAHRDMPWAAMEFLREAIKRNARRLKLQQWILLALRTLILLLLALAAAKPFLSGWNLLTGGPKVHRVLVIDASYSMAYEAEAQSLLDRSKELALQMVDNARPGEMFSVCLMADPPRVLVAGPAVDTRRVEQVLSGITATSGGAPLNPVLALTSELISDAKQSHRDVASHEIIFFTDLGKTTWNSTADPSSGTSELVESLAAQAALLVVDVGVPEPANLSVSNLAIAGSLATTATPVRLECLLTNHGTSNRENVVAELLIDGRSMDEQTLSLTAGRSVPVVFETPFAEPGWHSVEVRAAGDPLSIDNRAWLAVDVRPRVRVLCVEGSPNEARYLVRAINPSGDATSPLEPVVMPEGSLSEVPLDDFDCVFLCNIARFTSQEAEILKRYAEQGGGVVFFLGDRVIPEAYNQVLAPLPLANSLRASGALVRLVAFEQRDGDAPAVANFLPARVGELTTTTEFGIDPLEYRHPIAAAFEGRERTGLLTTPVTTYFKLAPVSSAGATAAIANTAGDPLLVTREFGAGTVAIVATSATLDTVDPTTGQSWTLMPAWPSFLPIVRELLSYTTARTQKQFAAGVGDVLEGPLPAGWSSSSVLLTRPDGRSDEVPVERNPTGSHWNYLSTDEPGIYSVATGSDENGEAQTLTRAAVNLDAAESDLTRTSVDDLPKSIAVRAVPTQRGDESLAHDAPIHRWLLYSVLALLLVESVVAWSFGGRAA